MHILELINYIISVVFTICYLYQFCYIPIALFFRKKDPEPCEQDHDFAVMICARNESTVISDIINSLKSQTYPQEHIHVFVMADNCTDDTAEKARCAGATVYTRTNTQFVGKGYALEALLGHLREDYPNGFDGYFVFDADNLLEPDYIEQMNRSFSSGNSIITSYRDSKNYGDNWISAGYGLWFLRESIYLNKARWLLGSSCAVSGTGFFFSREVADDIQTWPYHLLTEDIEFTIDQISKGRKVAFCRKAILYDEQPVKFVESWNQRLRWSRGYLQVFGKYGKQLLAGVFKGSFSCFDMAMCIMPAFILSAISIVCNVSIGVCGALAGDDIMIAVMSVLQLFGNMYAVLFAIGSITTITEWKNIHVSTFKKILYAFTFPLFMFTFIPVAFASFFCKTGWKPIKHTVTADSLHKEQSRS